MENIVFNDKLINDIIDYCKENGIEDVERFANRCTKQGFNIIRFGISPKDNLERQNKGIKDFENYEDNQFEKDTSGQAESKISERESNEKDNERETRVEERTIEPVRVVKQKKIRVIKKEKK